MGFRQAFVNQAPLIYALETRQKRMLVQELRKSILLWRLMKGAEHMDFQGRVLEIPYYPDGPPAAGAWIDAGSILPDPVKSVPMMGYVSHRYLAWPSGFNELDRWEVEKDPNQIIQEADVQAAEGAWGRRRMMTEALWNGTGGKQPDGISATIQAAAPASQTGTYAGVDRTTIPFQRNQFVALTTRAGYIAPGSGVPAILLAFNDLIDATTDGTRTCTDIYTGRQVIKNLRRAMQEVSSPYRMMSDREAVDRGFLQIMLEGVPIGWDPLCPTQSAFAFHMDDSGKKNRVRVTNDPRDTTDLDMELEDSPGISNVLDLSGNICILRHPNIRERKVDPRQGAKTLTSWSWIIDSWNLFFKRLGNTGRLGVTGSGDLETW